MERPYIALSIERVRLSIVLITDSSLFRVRLLLIKSRRRPCFVDFYAFEVRAVYYPSPGWCL